MSCYMVDTDLIDLLITAANSPDPHDRLTWNHGGTVHKLGSGDDTPERVGAMLLAENQRSVNYRYDEHDIEPIYQHRPVEPMPPIVHVLCAINCYGYQASEHPTWEESEAYRFCQSLKDSVIHYLPGYREAPWDWNRKAAAATAA